MSMTKKDFVFFAEMVKESHTDIPIDVVQRYASANLSIINDYERKELAEKLNEYFKERSKTYLPEVFFEACGFTIEWCAGCSGLILPLDEPHTHEEESYHENCCPTCEGDDQ